jgi:hypothetical protein
VLAKEDVMSANSIIEGINQNGRLLLSTTAAGIAAAGAASPPPLPLGAAPVGDPIRPFRIEVPEEEPADLRRRRQLIAPPSGTATKPQKKKFI